MIKYLVYILLFPISVLAQNISGTSTFPNNIPADSVKVILQGEEIPASYTIYPVTYNPLGTNGTSVTLYDDSNVGRPDLLRHSICRNAWAAWLPDNYRRVSE